MSENNNVNSNNELDIKSIGLLLDSNFRIPSYQRGYRWKIQQVKDLLNDIWDYIIDYSNPVAFYCLQPVVVKTISPKSYELIDGQQRLTTIVLILHYFNETEFKIPKKHYSLDFETRTKQKDFLKIITDVEQSKNNIDLYHLNQAYDYIKSWFENMEKNNPSIKGDFHSKLVNRTKVIWYEIKDQSSVIDIFTRLNIGKIPLTNAELIKALFLSKSSEISDENRFLKQISLATEWDRFEQTLQKPEFWYFICNKPDKYDTRIEYIFDLKMGKQEDDEQYTTFYKYYKAIENANDKSKKIDQLWLEIKEYFLTFDEWYNDREFFHLVGFLVATGSSVNEIKHKAKDITKTEFRKKLKSEARSIISVSLDSLSYYEHRKIIKNTLLLFNIFSILNSKKSNLRFPFDHFYQYHWDIEHIRSKTSKDINGKDRISWAKAVLEYFTGSVLDSFNEDYILSVAEKLSEKENQFCHQLIMIIKEEDKSNTVFNTLFDQLRIYFKEDDSLPDIDNLSNLTLLDEGTNRMYKNAFFPVKRKYIINKEKEGVFIPLCTKNVFLKAYSKKLGELMYWNNTDADDYFEEIEKILN